MGKSPKAPGSLFSRRGLIRAGFGVGTELLLPNLPGSIPFVRATPAHDHEPSDDDKGPKDFKPGAPFVEPEIRSSANGELNTTLRMQYAYKDIGGSRLYVRTYEGAVPGPTLRLKPGDVLRIKLINDFPTAIPSRSITRYRINSTPQIFTPTDCMSVRAASPTMSCA